VHNWTTGHLAGQVCDSSVSTQQQLIQATIARLASAAVLCAVPLKLCAVARCEHGDSGVAASEPPEILTRCRGAARAGTGPTTAHTSVPLPLGPGYQGPTNRHRRSHPRQLCRRRRSSGAHHSPPSAFCCGGISCAIRILVKAS